MINNRISAVVASFLVIGFFLLAVPEQGYSQEIEPGCCQYNLGTSDVLCEDTGGRCPRIRPPGTFDGFFPGATCNNVTGLCSALERNVPTLSEWGLLAMAAVLGIVGFIVMRRRTATA